MPSPAYLAAGVTPPETPGQLPYKARGVAQTPPAPKPFVMPSPEELGVASKLNVKSSEPSQGIDRVPAAAIDWNVVHARMERIGVLKFEKDRAATTGSVRVTLLLPTSDPTLAQPVVAVAATESEAVLAAVQYAETWMQRR